MIDSAPELYERARAALAEHRTAEASALLSRAAGACPSSDVELGLRIRISRAWITFEEQGCAPALEALSAAAAEARARGLPHVARTAEVQAGSLLARSGDRPAAWRALRGIDPDSLAAPDRMRLLLNRGTIASELRRFDEAAADLSLAADLADELGVRPVSFMARHNLGWVRFLRGDLPAALREMHDAEALDVDLDRSVARQDRARALVEAGLIDDAHELLLMAREGRPGAQQTAEVDLDLARCALLLGHPDEALERSRAAARVFRRRGADGWHRRAVLLQLMARPRIAAARALWEASLEVGDRLTAAQAAAAGMRAPSARDADVADLTPDVAWLSRSPVVSLRLAGLVALATAAARRGDADEARRVLRRANATLVHSQLGLASLDLRTASALHGEAAAALDLELAAPRGPSALVEAAERWRAATRPQPRVSPAADPRVREAATELRRLRAEFDPAGPSVEDDTRAIVAGERELRSLTWGAVTDLPPTATTLTAAALRRAARAHGCSLVVTVRRGDTVMAVVLGEGPDVVLSLGSAERAAELVEAARADLTAQANLHPAHPLAGAVAASLDARLAELGGQVAAPLEDLPGQLVVVPTRVLAGVPWLALPQLRGRPVTVAPTASSWAASGRVVHRPRVSVLIGPALPFAAQEADAISGCWPLVRAVGFPEALAADDVVHVAAHGEHRGDNPQFSSLLLADGPVFAHELEDIALRASHVVLSACEVGRATHRPGDQPLGLTATLLSAGAVCVIAPVAPIGDELAAAVMAAYHAELCGGADAATALASATHSHPSAGAFVCFGAPWRATV
ncbi:CHAT domain-containing protein [Tessaracoccus sp. Z1128]